MPDEKATIREFVEENDKLLAVLGIFVGVAAFTVNSQIRLIGQIVAFLFILAALLIWSELFYRFVRDKPPHRRLIFFYLVLTVAFLMTILYWMLEFNNIMRFALAGLLFEIVFIHVKSLGGETKFVRIVMWVAFWLIAFGVAVNMNNGLDRFRNYLMTKQSPTVAK